MVQELSSRGIEKVELWQRGVDTELFQPHLKSPAMRLKLSQNNPDSPLLLYVGRVSQKEIDCIKPVLEAIPEARFAIVGELATIGKR
jgi:glycosyltransferase involved in cell wall biosynthesis